MVDKPFEPKNLFRNPYFWIAVASALFLGYAVLIGFTLLPRRDPEASVEPADTRPREAGGISNSSGEARREQPVSKDGELSKARVELIANGGWIDTDNREMTVVLRVSGLEPETAREIIRSGLIEIGIDAVPATIINSEPYGGSGFLTRAKAILPGEKFENFQNGEIQSVEFSTTLKYRQETKTEIIGKRFAKRDKTEAEGVKIVWK